MELYIKGWDGFTLQGVPGEAQLADDVSRDVGLDTLTFLGMALCCLQQVVELLRIKLLQRTEVEEEDSQRVKMGKTSPSRSG